jgi:L-aminopeptidase/D-esterase-like protein
MIAAAPLKDEKNAALFVIRLSSLRACGPPSFGGAEKACTGIHRKSRARRAAQGRKARAHRETAGASSVSKNGGPGPNNDITDVGGLKVGNAADARIRTGATVILPDRPAIVAGDVRGGGPGTRETDLLRPSTLVDRADAIVLSGGSSYGLGAADGVAGWLGARGRGFSLVAVEGVPVSPIVPAAILYDLANGGDKNWGETPPYAALGREAAANATSAAVSLGASGAGIGAMAGNRKGGLGGASYVAADGVTVGALMAVNSFGSVTMPDTDIFWAWPYEFDQEFGGARPSREMSPVADMPSDTKLSATARANTTIGVVAINALLSQADAERVAIMAQDGIARAIRPVHGPTDGDVIFVLATGDRQVESPIEITRLGLIAADCVARAIARGVYLAGKSN